MTALASTDLTYTITDNVIVAGSGYRRIRATIAFGDGALTYPSGGVPILKAKLGMPNSIKSFVLLDDASSNGYVYKYDDANAKLRIYQSPARSHNHTLHFNNADVADGATTRINAGTNLLGANTGADIVVAGVADATGAGGIVTATLAVADLTEIGAVAVAAQSLKVLAEGW